MPADPDLPPYNVQKDVSTGGYWQFTAHMSGSRSSGSRVCENIAYGNSNGRRATAAGYGRWGYLIVISRNGTPLASSVTMVRTLRGSFGELTLVTALVKSLRVFVSPVAIISSKRCRMFWSR